MFCLFGALQGPCYNPFWASFDWLSSRGLGRLRRSQRNQGCEGVLSVWSAYMNDYCAGIGKRWMRRFFLKFSEPLFLAKTRVWQKTVIAMRSGVKKYAGWRTRIPKSSSGDPFLRSLIRLLAVPGWYRALGLRPFPGLGQKNDKNKKHGCFWVVRRAFRHWIMDSYTDFYSLFHGSNVFLSSPCFC